MSVDHDASVVVGYVIPLESFFKKMLKHSPEKSHKEDRFDPKTGKKLEPLKVVDTEEGYDIVICGKTYEGPGADDDLETFQPNDDVIEALSEALDCDVGVQGDFYNGCCIYVCLTSARMKYVDGVASFKEIAKHAKDIERIGKACKKLLKVEPGLAGAHAVMSVC